MRLKLESAGMSHPGLVREYNEDRFEELADYGLYVLADGMGGHKGGDVAAQLTVDVICRSVREHFPSRDESDSMTHEWAGDHLKESVEQANQEVNRRGKEDSALRGMGSTVCCLYAAGNEMVHAHVGDSRIYLLREGKLKQLTVDHSLLNQLVDTGALSPQEAAGYLYKHVITRAIGTRRRVIADVGHVQMQGGDLFLMCSDGLSDLVSSEEIAKILGMYEDLHEVCVHLIESALEAGGNDNVTVLVVRVCNV